MYSPETPETNFNKALRIVMAEFRISGVDLAEKAGLSRNSISRAKNDTDLQGSTILKISNALAEINIDAYEKFWQLASGSDSVFSKN